MKKILLHSITLTNWRGEKNRTTEFNVDAPTYICGNNGLGKSRHFDAFCWLLFGKDSQDRKDFELRTYDEHHEPLHRCECSVSAIISVDGVQHNLKREYKENWVKPRGQVEEVFAGNITECTWDSVPCKVSDYQKRISENIIDETVFKMITNPRYFVHNMKWQLQRETLMQMAGTKSDEELASGNDDFKKLLDALNGKSLADFRKELAAEKKRLKAEKDDIEPRIDQTDKMMPEAEDWAALTAQKHEYEERINSIEKALQGSGQLGSATLEQINGLVEKVSNLETKKRELLKQAREDVDKDVEQKNSQRTAIEKDCKEASTKLSDLNIDIKHTEDRIKYLNEQIAALGPQLGDLRNEWYEINKSVYDGSDICPHCGQRLPDNMIADAKKDFETHKAGLLKMNEERGKSLSQQNKSYADELVTKGEELKSLQSSQKATQKQLDLLYEELSKHPKITPNYPTSTPETEKIDKVLADLHNQITELQKPQTDDSMEQMRNDLRKEMEDKQQAISDINTRLAKKEQIAKGEKMIEQLQERGKELAQLIADCEKREYVAAQFSKKRITDCEQRINAMFKLVRWQLFDYTQDGNEYECCTPLIDGVPYDVANTASKINAGLDIINTLCRFNNTYAPIFCDNAESVNRYALTQSQMIYLVVTHDTKLVIK